MNKLTFEQIIEKLKTIFDSVDDFAHEEQPYDFENYPEALEAQKVRKEFRDKHIINNKWEEGKVEEYNNLPSEYDIIRNLWKEKNGLNWKEIEQQGGEDEGSNWYSIKYFKDHDIYIKVSGWYQSHHGTDFNGWEDCREVKPQQKTITVYE
jgi:hypothetical protein